MTTNLPLTADRGTSEDRGVNSPPHPSQAVADPIHPQAPACSDDAWKLCIDMMQWFARHPVESEGTVQSAMDPALYLYADTFERKDKGLTKTSQDGKSMVIRAGPQATPE